MRSLPALLPARDRSPVPAPIAPANPRTPGSLLAMPSGCVATELRPLGYDARRRAATYELLLANDSVSPVAAYAYVDGRPSGGMVSWNALTIAPFAAIAVTLEIALGDKARPARRVVVEVHADMAQLTLDATPHEVAPDTTFRHRGWAVAAVLAVLAIVGSFALVRPHIVALGAPQRAAAGSRIDVAYATTGAGSWNYRLQTPDGMQLRAGALDGRAGAFDVDLPASGTPQSYDLLVMGGGRLGSDMRTAHIVAYPAARRAQATPTVTIGALNVAREIVQSGAPIIATYRTDATSGSVQLVDGGGAVVSEAPLSSRGTATLVAPNVQRDEEFDVVLNARRGPATAQSSLGVVVRSSAPLYADPGQTNGTRPLQVAHDPPQGDAPFALPSAPIVGGGPIDIAIVNPREHMRITLATENGTELASANVEPGRPSIQLDAPAVSQDTKYLIEAAYPSAIGEETVIRPIVVHRR